jgi:hypothetical protein
MESIITLHVLPVNLYLGVDDSICKLNEHNNYIIYFSHFIKLWNHNENINDFLYDSACDCFIDDNINVHDWLKNRTHFYCLCRQYILLLPS